MCVCVCVCVCVRARENSATEGFFLGGGLIKQGVTDGAGGSRRGVESGGNRGVE